MQKSINQWSYPDGFSLSQFFDAAKAAGFGLAEPYFGLEGEISMASTDAQINAVARQAADAGVGIASLASALYWQYPPSHNDAAVRSRAQEIARRQLECAALLGTDTILVAPGLVDADTPYDAAYQRAQEFIAAILPHAQACGVTIGVENVWNKFLFSPLEARAFVDDFQSQRLGFYLDVGNIQAFGYPAQWVDILGKRVARVHIKDYRAAVGTGAGFVDLLSGDVDFAAVMAALRRVGYEGPLTTETTLCPWDDTQAGMAASAAMDKILAM